MFGITRSTRITTLVLVAILALAGAGAALALGTDTPDASTPHGKFINRVAALLGKEPAQVQAAMTRASGELVDEAVARGEITLERGERLKERLSRGKGPIAGLNRPEARGKITKIDGNMLTVQGHHGVKQVRLSADTKIRKNGASVDASNLRAGDRIIVQGRAGDGGTVVAKRVRVLTAKARPLRNLKHNVLTVSARYLGTQPKQLKAQLREGKSLAQIAGAARTPGLKKALLAAGERRIEMATAEGRLTEARAARLKQRLPELVDRLLRKEWSRAGER